MISEVLLFALYVVFELFVRYSNDLLSCLDLFGDLTCALKLFDDVTSFVCFTHVM